MSEQPQVPAVARSFGPCPDCGATELVSHPAGDVVVFTCSRCHASWRHVLGFLVSVR